MGDDGHRVIVIGAGLGGLAAACTLAARGYEVICLERNGWYGGKAAQLELDGYRFDMGPTILTLPSVLDRIFAEGKVRLDERLDLVRLDPQWRCFYHDGSALDLTADLDAMAGHVARFTGDMATADGYRRFMAISERLDEISERFFFWRSLGALRDAFDLRNAMRPSTLRDVWDLRLGRSVGSTVRSCVPESRVAQMLDHFTQYVGSSPFLSPAVLCGIAHMQVDQGVWYPRGGTRAVPEALARLAMELGVDLRTRAMVRRIEVSDGRVRGVQLESGESIHADLVLSNCDVVRTHRELIGGNIAARFDRRRRYEPACSGVVLFLALAKRYDHLLHHNFVFSRDAESEFDAIYKAGVPAPDPTCYVCAPSATEPAVAPDGGEALYVLVHAPYVRDGQDWDRLFPEYREKIIAKLQETGAMPDIEDRIVAERFLTPADINRRYHVLHGAIYGLASHGRLTGAFKPANRSPDVGGLYLAGGSAHPGAGMPMALMSGWIAADVIDQDHGEPNRREADR